MEMGPNLFIVPGTLAKSAQSLFEGVNRAALNESAEKRLKLNRLNRLFGGLLVGQLGILARYVFILPDPDISARTFFIVTRS